MHRPPPRFTLFPYTTLFRSRLRGQLGQAESGEAEGRAGAARDRACEIVRGAARCTDDDELRGGRASGEKDRKSTRLNSSHRCISYAVFCLKKKTTLNDTFVP